MIATTSQFSASDLISRCAARPADPVAWEEFVRSFHPLIHRSVSRALDLTNAELMPQLRETVIESLVQSVYIRLVEEGSCALKRARGIGASSFVKYLLLISINTVRQYSRQPIARGLTN